MAPGEAGFESTGADPWPSPGELRIKERRAWKTWQMAVAVVIAILVGFWLNGTTGGSTSSQSSEAPAYKLPTSGTTNTTTTAAPSGSTTTTASGGSTTTTTAPAGGSTTTPPAAAAGPARVLLGPTQMQGNWTSPAFTITAASWSIGWAFSCTPVPASGPSFQVSVVTSGSSPSGTPAISETGASGQSVSAQTTTGAQTLVVQAPTGCTWVVKVTGS
jgi:hypothetical protein